jgi:hypothetical protein
MSDNDMAKNENMEVYNRVRSVPKEALKPINGGRLKGMSDINPMWRLKMLTEVFGICGIGWKVEITDRRLEKGHGDEVVCFVDINLYVKVDGEWSEPIPGMGGSSFVTQERNGLYTSDECFKMAYTDAISVSCKALGFAADVYFANDRTKYTQTESETPNAKSNQGKKEEGAIPPSLKAKYQLGKGSVDGLEQWVDTMKKKGLNYSQMETFLIDLLNKKKEEQPA